MAVSSCEDIARQNGFTQTLHIPEGIGGRFSIWSAVGLPVALAVGPAVFERLLAGAAEMDAHFAQAPLERNAPVWLGLLDVWYGSFLRMPGRCVAPYHHGLRRLPAYLQQLEMESNGKQVRADGTPVGYPTTGMVWGEPGSNGQHAFFQWLHQGTQRIPVEFIAARTATHGLPEHQEALLANALAQAQALMQGSKAGPGQLAGHQDFPGNRPSTFMLLDALTPSRWAPCWPCMSTGCLWLERYGVSTVLTSGEWNWARRWPRICARAWILAICRGLTLPRRDCWRIAARKRSKSDEGLAWFPASAARRFCPSPGGGWN